MSGTLLTTKLHIPQTAPGLVPRPHLAERLDEGLRCRLTLVSAPAGFGKSTLVAGGLAESGQPAALSLRRHSSYGTFIEQSTGSHQFVLDCLTEEVLRWAAGHLSEIWRVRLEGLSMRHEPGGETALSGPLDQAALHEIVTRVRDLGAKLIAVSRLGRVASAATDPLDGSLAATALRLRSCSPAACRSW